MFGSLLTCKATGLEDDGDPPAASRRLVAVISSVLEVHEKRLYAQALKLLRDSNVLAAARILEQIGMNREAIQALEDRGHIHEATQILKRMHRPNRAGVVFARHGLWSEAAQCFQSANMPLEVGRCAREAGNFPLAAVNFEKAGRWEDAAICYEKIKDLHRAARLYSAANLLKPAMKSYEQLFKSTKNLGDLSLLEEELETIAGFVAQSLNQDYPHCIKALAFKGRVSKLILDLIYSQNKLLAAKVFQLCSPTLAANLLSDFNFESSEGPAFAEILIGAGQYQYGGIVLEKLQNYEQAAEAFDQAGDQTRSAYCYERLGKPKASLTQPVTSGQSADSSLPPPPPSRTKGGTTDQTPQAGVFSFDMAEADTSATLIDRTPSKSESSNSESNNSEPNKSESMPPLPKSAAPVLSAAAPQSPALITLPQSPTKSGRPSKSRKAKKFESDDYRANFHKAAFLSDLTFEQKDQVWSIGKTLTFKVNEDILTYDDEPTGVYVVTAGQLSCFKSRSNGPEEFIDQMGSGDTIGELWLLADQPTSVRFVAIDQVSVRLITREDFHQLLDRDGAIARKIYKRFTMRLIKRLMGNKIALANQAAS